MYRASLYPLARTLATLAATTLVGACSADAVVAPTSSQTDLGTCQNLRAPAGTTLAAHLFARGVQIYRWNDTSWVLITPSAVLFADRDEREAVGLHYAGPTWQVTAGATLVGTVVDRCTPDANAIPWLSLSAVSNAEPGVFQGASFIQRVRTTGGKAPTTAGRLTGDLASVPYTAEYLFYRSAGGGRLAGRLPAR